jgi:outer membrane protein OmpA-like peptidoglycan-associated protein
MTGKATSAVICLMIAAMLGAGCASKKYVRTELEAAEDETNERLNLIKAQIEDTQEDLAEQDERLGETSKTALDALERAIAAGKLAKGKLLYERVLSDDKVRFGFDEAQLSADARAALDLFARELLARNENVFIEIQGHTDSVGSEDYNMKLGERRAEAVRRYLNAQHAIPLHRMSVISYGESEPVTDNSNRDARAQNRRVVLVVLV